MKRLLFFVAAMAAAVVPSAAGWGQTATTISAGEFCATAEQGQSRTAGNGEQVTCTIAADGRLRWESAAQAANQLPATTTASPAAIDTTTTVAAAATPTTPTSVAAASPTPTTVASAMPNTGRPLGQEAALGAGVGALGALIVWRARPRLRALFSGPELIPYERIEEASDLLGWSKGWSEHLSR